MSFFLCKVAIRGREGKGVETLFRRIFHLQSGEVLCQQNGLVSGGFGRFLVALPIANIFRTLHGNWLTISYFDSSNAYPSSWVAFN